MSYVEFWWAGDLILDLRKNLKLAVWLKLRCGDGEHYNGWKRYIDGNAFGDLPGTEKLKKLIKEATDSYDAVDGDLFYKGIGKVDLEEETKAKITTAIRAAVNQELPFRYLYENLSHALSSYGLWKLYCRADWRVWDHAQLVSVIQAKIAFVPNDFLEEEAWSEYTQHELRQGPSLHREEKQERCDPLPFTGDGDSETDGPRPPLAWTVIWGGTYSNLFGGYVPHDIHRWGYVMWDALRLERTGAKELLVRQLKKEWKDTDPRDDLH
ncbi:MAG: hypothetical protein M1839_003667 [Geoglossum umbratile]|nr:MAG: hypothetical protein M1839_003667 [Geoglossum umbratile]